MKLTGCICNASAAIGLVSIGVLAMVGMTSLAQSQEFAPEFGYYSLSKGQTAQLNVFAPDPITPDPCEATLKFVDGDNEVFVDQRGDEVSIVVMLGTREDASVSLALPFEVAILSYDNSKRALFRPVIAVDDGRTCAELMATLEVFNQRTNKNEWVTEVTPVMPEFEATP